MSLLRREETVFSSPAETPLSTVCERTAKVGVEGQILDFGFKILECTSKIFMSPTLVH